MKNVRDAMRSGLRAHAEQQIPVPAEESEVDDKSDADDLDEDEWMDATAGGLISDDYAIQNEAAGLNQFVVPRDCP